MSEEELEGRGFIFSFFHYLWLTDPLNENQKVKLDIPDTICYKYGKPSLWYFSNSNGICRKNKDKLNIEKIKESFLKKTPKCKVVAYFVHFQSDEKGKNSIKLEYFDKQRLEQFLQVDDYDREGYLQRFIQPKGTKNSEIKVIWGQDLCYLQQYESKIPINDQKYDIYQRALLSQSVKSSAIEKHLHGKLLPSKIETLCNNISCHIQNITNFRRKVIHMELTFKMDEKDRLVLLYCDGIKTNHSIDKPGEIYEIPGQKIKIKNTMRKQTREISLPNYINQNSIPLTTPQKLMKSVSCQQCSELLDTQSTVMISLQMVVEAWQQDHIQEEGNKNIEIDVQKNRQDLNGFQIQREIKRFGVQKNYLLPKMVRELYPKMTPDELNNPENIFSFMNNQVAVCQSCYLKILDSYNRTESLSYLAKFYKKNETQYVQIPYNKVKTSYSELYKRAKESQNRFGSTFTDYGRMRTTMGSSEYYKRSQMSTPNTYIPGFDHYKPQSSKAGTRKYKPVLSSQFSSQDLEVEGIETLPDIREPQVVKQMIQDNDYYMNSKEISKENSKENLDQVKNFNTDNIKVQKTDGCETTISIHQNSEQTRTLDQMNSVNSQKNTNSTIKIDSIIKKQDVTQEYLQTTLTNINENDNSRFYSTSNLNQNKFLTTQTQCSIQESKKKTPYQQAQKVPKIHQSSKNIVLAQKLYQRLPKTAGSLNSNKRSTKSYSRLKTTEKDLFYKRFERDQCVSQNSKRFNKTFSQEMSGVKQKTDIEQFLGQSQQSSISKHYYIKQKNLERHLTDIQKQYRQLQRQQDEEDDY